MPLGGSQITLDSLDNQIHLAEHMLMELFLGSYLATPRQRRIGERRQVGPVPCVHYEYYWSGRFIRADNFFVSAENDLPAVMQAIRQYKPAEENQIFVPLIDPTVHEIMLNYGCEDRGSNYLMERPLSEVDKELVAAVPVSLVKSAEDVKLYNGISGGSLALRADAANIDFRYYYILVGEIPAAQGRSWQCRPAISWESHVYTDPNFQRRGFGKAVMSRILSDSARAGNQFSVLLATEAGRRLYQRLGYFDRLTIGCYKWRDEGMVG